MNKMSAHYRYYDPFLLFSCSKWTLNNLGISIVSVVFEPEFFFDMRMIATIKSAIIISIAIRQINIHIGVDIKYSSFVAYPYDMFTTIKEQIC